MNNPKLAWLCYDEDEERPEIRFDKPERYRWARVVPIVYFVLGE